MTSSSKQQPRTFDEGAELQYVELPPPRGHKESIRVPFRLWLKLKGPKPELVPTSATTYRPKIPEGWTWDGCTASPDNPGGVSVLPACFLHDLLKEMGRHAFGFLFYRNVFVCLTWDDQVAPWVARAQALAYSMVYYLGNLRRLLWGSTVATVVAALLVLVVMGWFASKAVTAFLGMGG